MPEKTNHFDTDALNWDNDIQKQERAKVFAVEINNFIKPANKLTALEFGCGTGLLSFQLKDVFKTITLADNSEGMINVLKDKIEKANIKNFIPLLIDLLKENNSNEKYDVVYSLMTLHHIVDLQSAFEQFNSFTSKNGYLCIADLVKEDGSFHENIDDFDGHNGFEKEELTDLFKKHCFEPVFYKICFEIEKEVDGSQRIYPLFLMIGRKN